MTTWGDVLNALFEQRQYRSEPRRSDLDESSYFRRRSDAVKARIRRLNPEGLEEGCIPRGWNPHPRINPHYTCAMPVRDFIRRFGRDAYRALPRTAFYRQGHRKAILATAAWSQPR